MHTRVCTSVYDLFLYITLVILARVLEFLHYKPSDRNNACNMHTLVQYYELVDIMHTNYYSS